MTTPDKPKPLFCKSKFHRFEGPYETIEVRNKRGILVTSRIICANCASERRAVVESLKKKGAKND